MSRTTLSVVGFFGAAVVGFGTGYTFRALGGGDPSAVSPPAPSTVARPLAPRDATEPVVRRCLGRPVREGVELLGIVKDRREWVQSPRGILSGCEYYGSDGASRVVIWVAPGEPMYRQPADGRGEWDYEAFLDCRVGGVEFRVTLPAVNVPVEMRQ